jgi:hypothetical protein
MFSFTSLIGFSLYHAHFITTKSSYFTGQKNLRLPPSTYLLNKGKHSSSTIFENLRRWKHYMKGNEALEVFLFYRNTPEQWVQRGADVEVLLPRDRPRVIWTRGS